MKSIDGAPNTQSSEPISLLMRIGPICATAANGRHRPFVALAEGRLLVSSQP
jgi:hypothetical protein